VSHHKCCQLSKGIYTQKINYPKEISITSLSTMLDKSIGKNEGTKDNSNTILYITITPS